MSARVVHARSELRGLAVTSVLICSLNELPQPRALRPSTNDQDECDQDIRRDQPSLGQVEGPDQGRDDAERNSDKERRHARILDERLQLADGSHGSDITSRRGPVKHDVVRKEERHRREHGSDVKELPDLPDQHAGIVAAVVKLLCRSEAGGLAGALRAITVQSEAASI
jgi:hypothetical protein